jgi:Dolichyl-phosphate-mannose-protein mannosyltransferase
VDVTFATNSSDTPTPRRWPIWLGLALILLFSAGVRFRLAAAPLERDEGDYAYCAQLLLQGIPPYRLAYDLKFPGISLAYAVILAVGGQTAMAIHIGTLVVNALNTVLVFLLARRLWDGRAALIAALVFSLLSLDQRSLGFAGHATHFVLPPALVAFLILLPRGKSIDIKRCAAAGCLLGIAMLVRQSAVPFLVFGYYLVLRSIISQGRTALGKGVVQSVAFFAAASLPIAAVLAWLWHAQVFRPFWFWTVQYARVYGSEVSLRNMPAIFLQSVQYLGGYSWPLWGLAVLGWITGWFDRQQRKNVALIGIFSVLSFAAVSAGFYFRAHYFILLMPAAALASASLFVTGTSAARQRRGLRLMVCGLFALAVLMYGTLEGQYWFQMTPSQTTQLIYAENPFLAAPVVGDYLQQHCDPHDTIAVIGSEPEIYFYARRHSATGYILTYPLMEPQPYALQMQQEMAREIESAQPAYLVLVNCKLSWIASPRSERWIFDWFSHYSQGYQLVGSIQQSDQGPVPLSAAQTAANPGMDNTLIIFRRDPGRIKAKD